MKATGGCICGAFTYSFDRDKVISCHHCHCSDCQKTTGCGKATIVLVPSSAVETQGELQTYTVQGSSGQHVSRGFCGKCGSPVMSHVVENPALCIIKAGSLSDSHWVRIQSSIWASSAVPWSPVDTSLPAASGNPGQS